MSHATWREAGLPIAVGFLPSACWWRLLKLFLLSLGRPKLHSYSGEVVLMLLQLLPLPFPPALQIHGINLINRGDRVIFRSGCTGMHWGGFGQTEASELGNRLVNL